MKATVQKSVKPGASSASPSPQERHSKYLADADLSRRKQDGVVYTPDFLADFVAKKVVSSYIADRSGDIDLGALRVLDPACGKGELLVATWHQLLKVGDQKGLRTKNVLCGIDIDKAAVLQTRKRLAGLQGQVGYSDDQTILITDGLFPFGADSRHDGWTRIRHQFDATEGFDIMIANPPWGADVSRIRPKLADQQYILGCGQFDTSDLFIEAAVENLRDGGYLGFIIPDSLFALERQPLRKFLLQHTEIRFIGRLGEKFFGGVNRACAVIVCKKTTSRRRRKVRCLRLTPSVRAKILTRQTSLQAAERKLSHLVPQSRFENNKDFRFDIDLTEPEESTLTRIVSAETTLRHHVNSGRGVELSKYGKVYQCPNCHAWAPLPTKKSTVCNTCASSIEVDSIDSISIVSKSGQEDYRSIIVGECIQRYTTRDSYWIDTGKEGINYKDPSVYKSPKIVVRKTGVGISAAMDYNDCLTNQVVYVLQRKDGNRVPLEFFLGVLLSRAIFFYTVKNHGETEWRSHPYVTQRQILDTPILTEDELLSRHGRHVTQISSIVKKISTSNRAISPGDDARIERAVAEIYGLDEQDYDVIYSTIDAAQDLIPIRALKDVSVRMIFDSGAN